MSFLLIVINKNRIFLILLIVTNKNIDYFQKFPNIFLRPFLSLNEQKRAQKYRYGDLIHFLIGDFQYSKVHPF